MQEELWQVLRNYNFDEGMMEGLVQAIQLNGGEIGPHSRQLWVCQGCLLCLVAQRIMPETVNTSCGILRKLRRWRWPDRRNWERAKGAINKHGEIAWKWVQGRARSRWAAAKTFTQYPAIHTNYSLSNCTISNKKDCNRSSDFLVIN